MGTPLVHASSSNEGRTSSTDVAVPVQRPTGIGMVARFDWISDRQNEIAKIVAIIALTAIAATGIGLIIEGTFALAGLLVIVGLPFLTMFGVVFNEVVKGIWDKSLMTFE